MEAKENKNGKGDLIMTESELVKELGKTIHTLRKSDVNLEFASAIIDTFITANQLSEKVAMGAMMVSIAIKNGDGAIFDGALDINDAFHILAEKYVRNLKKSY